MEYLTVNPNTTRISGSCGTVQSVLNITFSGGFINFVFVKVILAFNGKNGLGLRSWNPGCLWSSPSHRSDTGCAAGKGISSTSLLVFHMCVRHYYSYPSQGARIIEPLLVRAGRDLRPPGPTPAQSRATFNVTSGLACSNSEFWKVLVCNKQ